MTQSHGSQTDVRVREIIENEHGYENDNLVLIASQNYASRSVLEVQGSLFSNKHAGGYPNQRTLPGCENVDDLESVTIDRAKELFGAEHVNVQPYSGSLANMIVFLAVLDPGDKILSLDYTQGGHRTHGHPTHTTDKFFDIYHYSLDPDTGQIDLGTLAERAESVDPDIIVSGYSAYPREVEWTEIQAVADSVDAYHLADIAHPMGLIATEAHVSPVGTADFITGSTDKTLRAGRGGIIMCGNEHAETIDSTTYPGVQGGPIVHNIAGKAVGLREALDPDFADYIDRVLANTEMVARRLQSRGFDLRAGGTDTHLMVVDLSETHPTVSGKEAVDALQEVGIVVNKQAVLDDPRSASETSGLRIGTPAVTTRGLGSSEITEVADIIADVLDAAEDDETIGTEARGRIRELAANHPVY